MNASMIVLVAMTVVVATLAAYRWFITRNEDDTLHIGDPSGLVIGTQRHMADALKKIDDIGIALTVEYPTSPSA